MTQHDLAAAVAMPQATVARIEGGTVVPRTATLIAMLEACGHQLVVEPRGAEVDTAAIGRLMRLPVPSRTRHALPRAAEAVRPLRRLRRFGVPFVLIGELAEAVHGSPLKVATTLEVCHAQTDVALQRLGLALDDLGPDASRLRRVTQTEAGDDFEALARNAVKMFVDAGLLVQVAAIEDLVRIRLAKGTPADREAASVLRAIADQPAR